MEAEIGQATQPATGHERIEKGVVRVLAEIALGELQRPNAERPVEHQIEAEEVAPEASEMAEVVVLVESGALLEKISDLADRKQRCHEQERHQRPHDGDERDA